MLEVATSQFETAASIVKSLKCTGATPKDPTPFITIPSSELVPGRYVMTVMAAGKLDLGGGQWRGAFAIRKGTGSPPPLLFNGLTTGGEEARHVTTIIRVAENESITCTIRSATSPDGACGFHIVLTRIGD